MYPMVAWVEAPHLREIHTAMVQRLQDIADGTIQEDSAEHAVPLRGRSRSSRAPLQEGNRHTLLGVSIPSQAEDGFAALEAAIKALTVQASSVLLGLTRGMAAAREDREGGVPAAQGGAAPQHSPGAVASVGTCTDDEHISEATRSVSSASLSESQQGDNSAGDSDSESDASSAISPVAHRGHRPSRAASRAARRAIKSLHVVPRANLTLSALDTVSPRLHEGLAADPSIDELNKGVPAQLRSRQRSRSIGGRRNKA